MKIMTLTNFPDSQVVSSFCLASRDDQPYWLFRIFRGDTHRVYRLPEFVPDWPAESRWNHVEDREPLLSVARKRAIVF
jgi:hypothetical protein